MTDNHITIERDGQKNLNAIDEQLILELTDVARSFHDDLDTRAMVLTGAKDYFSAGADLEEQATRSDPSISDMQRRQIFYRGLRLNAIVTALNYTASYADADQNQLSAASQDARSASERFNAK